MIYTFRYLITDLYRCLTDLHTDFKAQLQSKTSMLIVYREQRISREELQEIRANIGQLYSTNTFLSTTFDRDITAMYAPDGLTLNTTDSEHTCFESVVFKYIVNTNIITKPYALLKNKSYYFDEDEVLFSIGTIFRIDSVEQSLSNNNQWDVTLTLAANADDEIQKELNFYIDQIHSTPTLLLLGDYLADIAHDYPKAEYYYRLFLEDQSIDDDYHKIMAHIKIGLIYVQKGEYATAIDTYETSLRTDSR
ncbi:unnamed protein product [Didymodactylos carnosus]|uniref:Tetratricopeptide repeat protein n=2 Tax=Didymodactylos carnosus TaxID=1234261 RepID=A0A814PH75_9BILA|nr:unnamed protein product [Didymodactylos carnosus]CAF3868694.1 unnamed protein product [Didymodactylos carnosus]